MIYKGLKAFDVYRENLVKYPCANKELTAHIFLFQIRDDNITMEVINKLEL